MKKGLTSSAAQWSTKNNAIAATSMITAETTAANGASSAPITPSNNTQNPMKPWVWRISAPIMSPMKWNDGLAEPRGSTPVDFTYAVHT